MTRKYAVFAAFFLLAACVANTQDTPGFSCPQTGIVPEAEKAVFVSDAGRATARIVNFKGGCGVDRQERYSFDLALDFAAVLDAPVPGKTGRIELPYFVAILAPDETVLQRQEFKTVLIPGDKASSVSSETHTLRFPGIRAAEAGRHKVAIGLILTPEQYRENTAPASLQKQTP